MIGFALAVALSAGFDAQITQVGFWPGGGSAWSGTTSYYGFGREVPYGYGFGPEAYAPRLGMMYPPRYGNPNPHGLVPPSPEPQLRRPLLGNGRILRNRR